MLQANNTHIWPQCENQKDLVNTIWEMKNSGKDMVDDDIIV